MRERESVNKSLSAQRLAKFCFLVFRDKPCCLPVRLQFVFRHDDAPYIPIKLIVLLLWQRVTGDKWTEWVGPLFGYVNAGPRTRDGSCDMKNGIFILLFILFLKSSGLMTVIVAGIESTESLGNYRMYKNSHSCITNLTELSFSREILFPNMGSRNSSNIELNIISHYQDRISGL